MGELHADGITGKRLRDFHDSVGFGYLAAQKVWAAGVNPVDAAAYKSAGAVTATEMVALANANVSGRSAVLLQGLGYTHGEMPAARNQGLSAGSIAGFYEAGVTERSVMIELLSAGVSGRTAAGYANAGMPDPLDMAAAYRQGISPKSIRGLTECGYSVGQITTAFTQAEESGQIVSEIAEVREAVLLFGDLGKSLLSVWSAPKQTLALCNSSVSFREQLSELTHDALRELVTLIETCGLGREEAENAIEFLS